VVSFTWLTAQSAQSAHFCPDQRQHYHQLFDVHPKASIYNANQESAYKAAKVSIRVATLASTPKILVKFSVHYLSHMHIHTSNTVHP